MPEYTLPAPCEGAGCAGPTKPQETPEYWRVWSLPEISKCPIALSYAVMHALSWADTVHEMHCEDEGRLFPHAIQEFCENPLILLRFLPYDTTDAVRAEAERWLRARKWPIA